MPEPLTDPDDLDLSDSDHERLKQVVSQLSADTTTSDPSVRITTWHTACEEASDLLESSRAAGRSLVPFLADVVANSTRHELESAADEVVFGGLVRDARFRAATLIEDVATPELVADYENANAPLDALIGVLGATLARGKHDRVRRICLRALGEIARSCPDRVMAPLEARDLTEPIAEVAVNITIENSDKGTRRAGLRLLALAARTPSAITIHSDVREAVMLAAETDDYRSHVFAGLVVDALSLSTLSYPEPGPDTLETIRVIDPAVETVDGFVDCIRHAPIDDRDQYAASLGGAVATCDIEIDVPDSLIERVRQTSSIERWTAEWLLGEAIVARAQGMPCRDALVAQITDTSGRPRSLATQVLGEVVAANTDTRPTDPRSLIDQVRDSRNLQRFQAARVLGEVVVARSRETADVVQLQERIEADPRVDRNDVTQIVGEAAAAHGGGATARVPDELLDALAAGSRLDRELVASAIGEFALVTAEMDCNDGIAVLIAAIDNASRLKEAQCVQALGVLAAVGDGSVTADVPESLLQQVKERTGRAADAATEAAGRSLITRRNSTADSTFEALIERVVQTNDASRANSTIHGLTNSEQQKPARALGELVISTGGHDGVPAPPVECVHDTTGPERKRLATAIGLMTAAIDQRDIEFPELFVDRVQVSNGTYRESAIMVLGVIARFGIQGIDPDDVVHELADQYASEGGLLTGFPTSAICELVAADIPGSDTLVESLVAAVREANGHERKRRAVTLGTVVATTDGHVIEPAPDALVDRVDATTGGMADALARGLGEVVAMEQSLSDGPPPALVQAVRETPFSATNDRLDRAAMALGETAALTDSMIIEGAPDVLFEYLRGTSLPQRCWAAKAIGEIVANPDAEAAVYNIVTVITTLARVPDSGAKPLMPVLTEPLQILVMEGVVAPRVLLSALGIHDQSDSARFISFLDNVEGDHHLTVVVAAAVDQLEDSTLPDLHREIREYLQDSDISSASQLALTTILTRLDE